MGSHKGKHRENRKTLPFENLFGCQYVKVVFTVIITTVTITAVTIATVTITTVPITTVTITTITITKSQTFLDKKCQSE